MSAIQTNSDIPIAASTVAELVALQPQPDGSIVYLESQALFYVQVYVLPPGVVTSTDGSSGAIAGRTLGTYWVQLWLLAGLGGATRRARGVVNQYVVDLAHFLVTGGAGPPPGNDGIVFVEGDTVLLIGQHAGEGPEAGMQNGPYIVGPVSGGAAPLTRPPWYPTGSTQKFGAIPIEIGCEGIIWGNTTFRAMGFQEFGVVVALGDSYVVDTDDPGWYCEDVTNPGTFVAGVLDQIIPLFSALSTVNLTHFAQPATTVSYNVTLLPGNWGVSGGFTIIATLAAGGTDTANNEQVNFEVLNTAWAAPPRPPT